MLHTIVMLLIFAVLGTSCTKKEEISSRTFNEKQALKKDKDKAPRQAESAAFDEKNKELALFDCDNPRGFYAHANATPRRAKVGDVINFEGRSNARIEYWDFDDGSRYVYKPNTTHSYRLPKRYYARFHASDSISSSCEEVSDFVTVDISDGPTNADFLLQNLVISKATSAKVYVNTRHDGRELWVNWGDGQETYINGIWYNFDVPRPLEHTYAASGEYQITVRTKNLYAEDVKVQTITVVEQAVAPQLQIHNLPQIQAVAGQLRELQPIVYISNDDTISMVNVNWGDGTETTLSMASLDKVSATIIDQGQVFLKIPFEHRYKLGGVYQVAVTATDSEGAVSGITFAFVTKNTAPVIAPIKISRNIGISRALLFSIDPTKSRDVDGDPSQLVYSWKVEDENLELVDAPGCLFGNASLSLTCQFPQDGSYRITVTGVDPIGGSGKRVVKVRVVNRMPVIPNFKFQKTPQSNTVNFSVIEPTIRDIDGHLPSLPLWHVQATDGTSVSGCEDASANTFSCTFTTPGVYEVGLTVTDDVGASNQRLKRIRIR